MHILSPPLPALVHGKYFILFFGYKFAYSKYKVTDLLKAFLGNGSVNMFQRETMEAVSQ
jgi:hypothetical protein